MKSIKIWGSMLFLLLLMGSTLWFLLGTMTTKQITPTNYSLSQGSKGKSVRDWYRRSRASPLLHTT